MGREGGTACFYTLVQFEVDKKSWILSIGIDRCDHRYNRSIRTDALSVITTSDELNNPVLLPDRSVVLAGSVSLVTQSI